MTRHLLSIATGGIVLLVCLITPPSFAIIKGAPEEGEGVLGTNDISVVLEGNGLWIRVTPMEEEILRYCTEDTRNTYTKMIDKHKESLKDVEKGSRKFLVLFQGRSENEIYFEPTELNIFHQGKLYKPLKILPITSTFDKRILTLYGTPEMAIYVFKKDIDLLLPITFRYKELSSDKWQDIIKTVQGSKLLVE
jgi:hypothetical protein